MASNARNLIVLSDGTGNSAAKTSKTNVWRLYQAIDLTDGTQIAVFGDGVGTSSVTLLRVLGLALGIGVKRNVLNLYKFLCRNYEKGDQIWAFGYSRGAFTIRVLAGLIAREGLVSWTTEAELDRNALLVLIAVAYPLLANYLQNGLTDRVDETAGGIVGWVLGLISGFVPGLAAPWIDAIRQHPAIAAIVLFLLYVSFRISTALQQRICDRARATWVLKEDKKETGEAKEMKTRVKLLQPTGQRGALLETTLWLTAFAIGSWALRHEIPYGERWSVGFLIGAVAFGARWAYRLKNPAGEIDPANPGFFYSFARKIRNSDPAKAAYKLTAQFAFPAGFLFAIALAVLFLGNRAAFDLASAGGAYCAGEKVDVADEKLGTFENFETRSLCQPTGLWLIEGRKYRIRLDMNEGVDGAWFDKGYGPMFAGFAANNVLIFMASPLKRWWWENWFQPIARIGEAGNYEHVLRPAAPLPVVDFRDCRPPEEKLRDIFSPATAVFKETKLTCEASEGKAKPNRTLISDITADATGELFIYVDDAEVTFPGLTDLFYQNNSGSAKVTVTRVVADSIIASPADIASIASPAERQRAPLTRRE